MLPMNSARSTSRLLKLVTAALTITLASCFAAAQTEPNLENGFKPNGSYSGSNIDTINLENGNLMLHIPMPFSVPQRGKVQPSYFFGITSKKWSRICGPYCSWSPGPLEPAPQPLFTGPGFDNPFDIAVTRSTHTVENTLEPTENQYKAGGIGGIATSDGAMHKFVGVTTDLTGYVASESNPDEHGINQTATVRDRAGNVYAMGPWQDFSCKVSTQTIEDPNNPGHFGNITTTDCTQSARVTSVTDSNGNQITFGGLDTMGRPATFEGFTGTQTTTDYTGCVSPASQPVSSATISNYTGFNGAVNQVKICYSNLSLSTSFGLSGTAEWPQPGGLDSPFSMVVSIVFLVDGSTWSFQYNSYGDITYVGVPLGGNIQYSWQTHSFPNCPWDNPSAPANVSRAVTQRTITDNNGNAYTWNYQYGTAACGSPLVNTMTDPLGNDTVNTFNQLPAPAGSSINDNPAPFFVSTVKHYQGSQASNIVLKREDFQYYNNGLTGGSNIVDGFVTQATTTINGKVSQVTRTPDAGFGPAAFPPVGVVTVEKKYDFGQGQHGSLLRETDTSYMWQGTGTSAQQYRAANLLDLPASVQVKNATGNICAETDNGFDDPNGLTAYTGAFNHVAAPNPVRGNLTSVSRKLSSTACSITAATPSVTSTSKWYDTGEIQQSADPLNHVTTHTYDSLYYGAYPTQTCSPQTGTVTHCVSGTYDFGTGLITSFTDANNQISRFGYDNEGRMTSGVLPADLAGLHPETDFSYPNLTTFQRTKKQDATHNIVDYRYFDGLGRTKQTRLVDPEGDDFIEPIYDGLDHVVSTPNQHRSVASSTDGKTTSYYDALGRIVQVAPQDGTLLPAGTPVTQCQSNNICTDYSNFPTVTTTDQTGKLRRSRTDALGRLVEVDEPGTQPPPQVNHATMQTDGNFVLANSAGTPLWSTGTSGVANAQSILMQDDGNLVLYIFMWSAGTYRTPVHGSYPSSSCSIGTYLMAGQILPSGKCIVSPDGEYFLYMSPDGNFYIYDWYRATGTWGPGTQGHPGAYAYFQTDGNLVVYDVNGVALWNSGTAGSNAQRLDLEDDGRIIIWKSAWSSNTATGQSYTTNLAHPGCDAGIGTGWTGVLGSGQCFVSPNGHFELLMQTDGNLVINDLSITPANTLWSTNTGLTQFSAGYAFVTTYTYDVLGNLTQVNQAGDGSQAARIRTFTYDTLSRLLTSANPESGTIGYTYDNDGNLISKTDARGITINYSPSDAPIDAQHRVLKKTYSNGDTPVTFTYDQGANANGRLSSAAVGSITRSFSYDPLGRAVSQTDCLPSGCRTTSVPNTGYNLASQLTSLIYPDGRNVTSGFNTAGRITGVNLAGFNGTQVNLPYYTVPQSTQANAWGYLPSGTMNRGSYGNNLVETVGYNNRLQIAAVADVLGANTLFSKSYGYYDASGHNNGNVLTITDGLNSAKNQAYTYDQLNRIATAVETDNAFNLTFTIDPWGNRNESGTSNFNQLFDTKNRIQGWSYDAAGNLLNDGTHAYTYDAESRVKTIDSTAVTYTYGPGGDRVRKDTSTGSTEYIYFGGGVIAELNPATGAWTDYIFASGKRIAKDTSNNRSGAQYYQGDHLGSSRLMTDASGIVISNCTYAPYGEQVGCSPDNTSNHYHFTGKERDPESTSTGIDYFGARYYASSFGRFMTPDWSVGPATVPYAHLENPQTLNLYAYVDNNPINGIDLDGHSRNEYMVAGPGWNLTGIMLSGKGGLEGFSPLKDPPQQELQQQAQGQNSEEQRIPDELFLGLPGPPRLATTPSLTITTVGGCGSGDAFCNTLWKLSDPSEDGGFIIQEIRAIGGLLHYWEAWRVNAGQQYTDIVDPNKVATSADDFWSSHGVTANATFYEGLQKLPDSFKNEGEIGHIPQSGTRPSTDQDPTSMLPLDRASNTVSRSFP